MNDYDKQRHEQVKKIIIDEFGKNKILVGCHIGLFRGEMEVSLLDEFPNLCIYGIDPTGCYVHFKQEVSGEERQDKLRIFKDIILLAFRYDDIMQRIHQIADGFDCRVTVMNIQELRKRTDLWHRFELIPKTSDDAYDMIKTQPVNYYDYIYIDGDHRYEQVRRDILNFGSLLSPGGLVIGDDYHPAEYYSVITSETRGPEVKRAVDELIPSARIVEAGTWWAKKEDIRFTTNS